MTAVGAEAAIRFAEGSCADIPATVARWKAVAGGKAVGCFPLYAPAEVIAAAGMLPVTLWGNEFRPGVSGRLPPYLCSVSRGILAGILGGTWGESLDAFAFPSTCDTAQNAAEVLRLSASGRPVFPLVFPLGPSVPGAAEFLLDRLEAFVEWTEKVGGRPVREGALDRAIRQENARRRLFARLEERMAEAPGLFLAGEYGILARSGMALPAPVHAEVLRAALGRNGPEGRRSGPKVFLSGMMAPRVVLEILDEAGSPLVGDDLASGHRHYATPAEESGDPLLALAMRHLCRGPCPTLHGTGPERVDELFARFAARGADRLVLLRMRQCEPEGGEVPAIAEEARRRGIPFLCVDVDLVAEGDAGLRVRIEAFLEAGRS